MSDDSNSNSDSDQSSFPAVQAQIIDLEDSTLFRRAYSLAQTLYRDELTIADISKLDHGCLVAKTLLEMGAHVNTIIAGLLNHVSSEDGYAQIEQVLNKEIVTTLRQLRKLDIYTTQAQNKNKRTLEAIRRAALTTVGGDVRIVMIRLAMALHTLRAAKDLDPERRKLIAKDTRNIYGPIANRLGIWNIKWELEDLSFRFLEPEAYQQIVNALNEKRVERERLIERSKRVLNEMLSAENISAEVTGRPKHIYSIYRKMLRKNVSFDQIFDAHALRVIIEQDLPEAPELSDNERKYAKYAECYRTLGIVHSIWKPIPSEYDDYIQHPKPNGYRSLHTAVTDEDGHTLEIQIRTQQMHKVAEQGFAAHWAYKEGGKPSAAMMRQIGSLRHLLNAMGDQVTVGIDEDEAVRDEAVVDRVFVFTPNGDLMDLPLGATPLDFAYAVHTKVGHRTRGSKVNGKMVPLTYTLSSGDRVEIITFGKKDDKYALGKPSRAWMDPSSGYTRTNRARSRIRKWFRDNEREQNIEYGRIRVEREIKRLKAIGKVTIKDLADGREETEEDFLSSVGFGDVSSSQLEGNIALLLRDLREEAVVEEPVLAPRRLPRRKKASGPLVQGMEGLETHIAKCCSPIPPQPIIGYVTRSRGVTIHRTDCKQAVSAEKMEPERMLAADWGEQSDDRTYSMPFTVKAYRGPSLIKEIATMLQGQNVSLLKSKSVNLKNHTAIYIEAGVNGMTQAEWVKSKLETLDRVFEVKSPQHA